MKLIIDNGNSFTKLAIFNESELVDLVSYSNFALSDLQEITKKYPQIEASILSSVGKIDNDIMDFLKSEYHFIELDHQTPVPFTIQYRTPETLGKDRIAAVAALLGKYPDQNALVIDAGTCITYDLLTKDAIYIGGSISPGMEMRFKALNTFTARLPKLNYKEIDFLSGSSTEESILSGVLNGISAEIDGIIDAYRENYEILTIILTGGDYIYFDKRLKNNIFALPNMVLEGLNIILDFNGKKLD